MKKILSLLIIGCAFIVACSTSQSIVDGGSKPSEGQEDTGIKGGEVEVTLYSKDKADTVPSSINFMFYESPVLHYQDSINRMIKTYISGIVSAGGGATEQNSDLSVEYIEESMDKFKDEYNRQLEFVDGGGVWQSETMIEIHEEYPNFAELSMGNWNYMGGAHGNAG
ncbi:MAG: hypothetical protein AB8B56_12285, partial [Crocinitomicaceae bacterium]